MFCYSHLHAEFWKTLSSHLEIEPPTEVDRCLGRKHVFHHSEDSAEVEFDMVDFIQSSCDFYVKLAGKPLKEASSPYLPEGSLPLTEWESRGELSGTASRILSTHENSLVRPALPTRHSKSNRSFVSSRYMLEYCRRQTFV